MEIPRYLAMTAAEFRRAVQLPTHLAWMACHFSAYGTGLSNVPRTLPRSSMLMLNDRTPICGHDPEAVAKTLIETGSTLECKCILLDFQREGCEALFSVIDAVLKRANCPVGVSAPYAIGFDCPVLVPPIPPHILPAEALAPWEGRELWLELSAEGTEICVTEEGSRSTPLPNYIPTEPSHQETALYCHYTITLEEGRILFQLGRTKEDQASLLEATKALGVTHALGLWQEIKSQPAVPAAIFATNLPRERHT